MKVHSPKIMGCILLVTKTLVWWNKLIKGLFSIPPISADLTLVRVRLVAKKQDFVPNDCFLSGAYK